MMNFGYNNRWIRLVKDLLFVGVGIWLFTLRNFLAGFVAILAIAWYGRDAYYQAKVLWQEKHYQAPQPDIKTSAPKDEKITVTNLNDAKEVNFEKE
ncbi:MAG: hypothetical protein IJT74_00170 [Bacteroidales bacterium]|nr:hypothetical protein [Bacteroidales bacterium]